MNRRVVIIVGAGAAGLAAAQVLSAVGCTVHILEARNSIGGRACTLPAQNSSNVTESKPCGSLGDNSSGSSCTSSTAEGSPSREAFNTMACHHPVELGAEFIHGEGAVTHQLVEQLGMSVVPVTRMENLWWAESGSAAKLASELPAHQVNKIMGLIEDEKSLAQQNMQHDMSLADYLTVVRSRSNYDVACADVLLAQTRCSSVHDLSCHDIQYEHQVDTAGSAECRVADGYSALLKRYSEGLNIQLNAEVTSIVWTPQHLAAAVQQQAAAHNSKQEQRAAADTADASSQHMQRQVSQQQQQCAYAATIRTAAGQLYQADAVVVTASIAALQQGGITFDPPLSMPKLAAVRALRMEAATKLIYCFSKQLWPDELTYMCHTGLFARWWTPGYGRTNPELPHKSIIIAYVTAERAKKVDALSEAEAVQLGLQELCQLLQLQQHEASLCLVSAKRVSWAAEPFIWGGYAHVPPGVGGFNIRVDLAKPEAGVLFFAGEATAHDSNPQTVHGALQSGWRAAKEVLETFGVDNTGACDK